MVLVRVLHVSNTLQFIKNYGNTYSLDEDIYYSTTHILHQHLLLNFTMEFSSFQLSIYNLWCNQTNDYMK